MQKHSGSKYESSIELKLTTARDSWTCTSCQKEINPGDSYYRQSLGLIRKPPNICLNAFCLDCEDSELARKLTRTPKHSNHPRSLRSEINKDLFDEPSLEQQRLL